MSRNSGNYYDPWEEMHAFYSLDDPTEEEQFRFVEAMKYIISTDYNPVNIKTSSYNLAMYYRDIKDFRLARKYLEIGADLGDVFSKEQLGVMYYYGFDGLQDFEKAYHLFEGCGTRRSLCMLADMYRFGQYVEQDLIKSRAILEDLMDRVDSERRDRRFAESTLFPEIAVRFVQIDLSEEEDFEFNLDCLFDAREILSLRQSRRPFWGNIRTMRNILETTLLMCRNEFDYIGLYDLLTSDLQNGHVTFDYGGKPYRITIFLHGDELIYQYEGKWFHGADDFLEKARIDGQRITTVYDLISNIHASGSDI